MKKPLVVPGVTVPPKPVAPAKSIGIPTRAPGPLIALPRLESAFVWAVWAALFLGAIVFVRCYGSNVPGLDEWHLVPKIVGREPVTWGWLWFPFNEHRVPLTRIVGVCVTRLWSYDFRAGMYLNVAALGALAFAMILTARKLRGHVSSADAFFPLVLLHLGHWQNFLQGWSVQVAVTLLGGTVLIVMALTPERLSLRTGVLAGLCVIVLPLCGAPGAVVSIPIAVWLLLGEALPWPSNTRAPFNPSRLLIGGIAAAALWLVVVGYALDIKEKLFPGLADRPNVTALSTILQNGLRVLSIGFGPGVQSAPGTYTQRGELFLLGNYPPEPQIWPVSGLAALLLLAFSAGLLVFIWFAARPERFRTLRLGSVLCGTVALAFAIGWGRSMEGPNTMFRSRYAVEVALVWCVVYFVGLIYSSRVVGRLLCVGLFLLLCLLSQGSFAEGVYWGKKTRSIYEAFERDLVAKMPANLLAESYYQRVHISFHPFARDEVETSLTQLAEAGGRWAGYVEKAAPHREVEVPIAPTETTELTFEGGIGYGRGSNPRMTYSLKEPILVGAIRITLSMNYGNPTPGPAAFRIGWRESEPGRTMERMELIDVDTGPEQQTVFVWVDTTIDRFEIQPDIKPCVIRIMEIVLLVPESG